MSSTERYDTYKTTLDLLIARRSDYDPKSQDEIKGMVMEWKTSTGTRKKRIENELLVRYSKMIRKIVAVFMGYSAVVPKDEIESEALFSFGRALEGYDIEQGTTFGTYADATIRKNMLMMMKRSGQFSKGFDNLWGTMFYSIRKRMYHVALLPYEKQDAAREKVFQEYATECNVTINDVKETYAALLPPTIANFGDHFEEGVPTIMLLDEDHPEEQIIHASGMSRRRSLLASAVDTLTPREADILIGQSLQYDVQTLEEFSQKYQISRERVRQVRNRAQEKVAQHVLASSKNLGLTFDDLMA